jgi:drug/metabolite transporter (DMT)-like permease
MVFLGSGIIDTSLKYLEDTHVATNDVAIFSATIFGSAALIGIIILLFRVLQGEFKFAIKNLLGGILLGVPNYFSVYFIVQALRSNILESSGIFTVNNVAVVLTSTIVGILLFKEYLSLKNWMGIILAIVSIVLITFNTF